MMVDKETGCPFCNIAQERILVENGHAIAVRDNFPVNPGHALVVSRRHVADSATGLRHTILFRDRRLPYLSNTRGSVILLDTTSRLDKVTTRKSYMKVILS